MPRSDDYKAAIALAVAELKHLNPKRLENRTGAQHFVEAAQEGLIVPYFGQARRITWPEVSVTPGNGAGRNFPPGADPHPPLPAQRLGRTSHRPDHRFPPGPGRRFLLVRLRLPGPKAVAWRPSATTCRSTSRWRQPWGENPCPWAMPPPGLWPFPGCPSPMSCGGETRNLLPRPPSCSMQPSPNISPPRTSPPSPAPRSTA